MVTRREFLVQSVAAATFPLSRDGIVQTVLGPLSASKLGFTLTHEHLADAPGDLSKWPKAAGGRAGFVAKAVEKLEVVRAAGVSSIVDLTTYDVGRDIRFLAEVSRKSGINMIACTGQRFFPPVTRVSMPARTIEGLSAFFRTEIEQGIDGTDIKAGVIKVGIVGQDLTPLEEVGLRAAARASQATGAPIRTHSDAAHRAGENQAAILEDEGVDPARVSFDHSDDSGDMDYFLGLVRRGYSLGMDHVHRGASASVKPSLERRAECIKLLVDAGFADKVFLSQDSEFGGALLPADLRDWREKMDPPEGLLFVARELVSHLEGMGVSDQQIHLMTESAAVFCQGDSPRPLSRESQQETRQRHFSMFAVVMRAVQGSTIALACVHDFPATRSARGHDAQPFNIRGGAASWPRCASSPIR
jgi:phosphotriesterase-related protein